MNEIEIKNLTKSFSDKVILDNISLTIEKGDIFGVLGLSGAGKSTLVRCINGLEKVDKGEIYYQDELITEKNIKTTRRKIAMIFQKFNLLQQRNVLDNVLISTELFKNETTKKESIDKAISLLTLVGLEDKSKSYPSQLSGGQQQRVAIARALMSNPQVLLCDEATSSLDPDTTESILELLKKLNLEMGLTIIMISHQMSVIEKICNKVAVIADSKIIEQGDTATIFTNPKTEITKKLVYSNHIVTKLDDNKLIKIIFNGNIDQPLITNIIQDCNIVVSIVYASSRIVEGRIYGQIIFKLPYYEEDINKLKLYLKNKEVDFMEVSKDEFNEFR